MRSSILLFEQRRADNPMVVTPSTRHLMDAVARMEDEGFKQIVLCGLQSEDPELLADLAAEIQRFMAARKERASVLETAAAGDFEQLDPDWTAAGFIPHGPSGHGPFDGLTEADYTTSQLRYGQFECLDETGTVVGALIVIPNAYIPLRNTPWSSTDNWCWLDGEAWPDRFTLRGVSAPIDTSQFGAWETFGLESFQDFGTVPPASGQLYRIVGSTNQVIGYLNRELVPPNDQSWWALHGELNSKNLFAVGVGQVLVFDTVSQPGQDLTGMWNLVSPAL